MQHDTEGSQRRAAVWAQIAQAEALERLADVFDSATDEDHPHPITTSTR